MNNKNKENIKNPVHWEITWIDFLKLPLSDMHQQHLPTHNVMIEKLKHLRRKHRALDFLQYITSFSCIIVVFLWIHYTSSSSLRLQAGHKISCHQQKGINYCTSFSTHKYRDRTIYSQRLKTHILFFLPCEYHTTIALCTTVTQILMSWKSSIKLCS